MCAGATAGRAVEGTFPASLPDVNNFPELYRDMPLCLDQVELDWKMVKEFDYYCMGVAVKEGDRNLRAQERGEYTPPFLNKTRVTFVAAPNLARELLDKTELDTTYPVRIYCTVASSPSLMRELGNVYWVARVNRVDCYGPDGAVAWTIPARGAPAEEAEAPEVEESEEAGSPE